jgi:hypothetical protein
MEKAVTPGDPRRTNGRKSFQSADSGDGLPRAAICRLDSSSKTRAHGVSEREPDHRSDVKVGHVDRVIRDKVQR